jgi:hypothetical protein
MDEKEYCPSEKFETRVARYEYREILRKKGLK